MKPTPEVGELWRARGLWKGDGISTVRIEEVLESGNVDVNYELDPSKPQDLRILPWQCLIAREPAA